MTKFRTKNPPDRGEGAAGEEVVVRLSVGPIVLTGQLGIPPGARGIVLFAHGSGSGRLSPRNRYVAQGLRREGLATLLTDLLTEDEEARDMLTAELRFNITLLAQRLVGIAEWVRRQPGTQKMPIGCFGASTGGGAALVAAAEQPDLMSAVVSRGGRPDLAGAALPRVQAPTLLIVGGEDAQVIEMNEAAYQHLRCEKNLEIVPGATHLFEEPGALEIVTTLAGAWFARYLTPRVPPA